MNIEIKNLKHSELASQETHCFTATVYVDGKKSFSVQNDGHGGCNNYHKITGGVDNVYELVKQIDNELGKEELKQDNFTINNCLEIVIGDLVNNKLIEKVVKRVLKKIAYIKPNNELYTVKLPATPENIARVKSLEWYKSEYIMLNEMELSEAINLYRKAS